MANTQVISVRISDEDSNKLANIANHEQLYKSELIRKAIREYIESYYSVSTLIEPS